MQNINPTHLLWQRTWWLYSILIFREYSDNWSWCLWFFNYFWRKNSAKYSKHCGFILKYAEHISKQTRIWISLDEESQCSVILEPWVPIKFILSHKTYQIWWWEMNTFGQNAHEDIRKSCKGLFFTLWSKFDKNDTTNFLVLYFICFRPYKE